MENITGFYGNRYLNLFFQPNVDNDGNFHLDYYGSGDVSGDTVINWADYDLMVSGIFNDMSDVDGDGISSTTSDQQLLYNYLTDQIPYLPGHWEFLTETEKISWIEKVLVIDQTNTHPPGPNWDCDQYSRQTEFNIRSLGNPSGAPLNWNVYDSTMLGRFNIPVSETETRYENGDAHRINEVVIGDSALSFTGRYFFEPQTDQRQYGGDASLNDFANGKVYVYVCNPAFQQYMYPTRGLVNFGLDANGQPTGPGTPQHPDLVLTKPEKLSYIHFPGVEHPTDTLINWEQGIDTTVTGGATGVPGWATAHYSIDSTNLTTDPWDSTTYNGSNWESWGVTSDSCSTIDSVLATLDTVNFPGRFARVVTRQDTTKPYWISFPPAYVLLPFGSTPPSYPTGGDNCGYYTITDSLVSNKHPNPDSCGFYSYTDSTFYNIIDPSGNSRDSLAVAEYYLENPEFTFVPADGEYDFRIDPIPENTGGYATATSATGNVEVTYQNNFNKNPDSTQCGHYNFSGERVWTATDSTCSPPNTSFEIQLLDFYKPMSLFYTSFPEDITIGKNDPKEPWFTGEPTGQDSIVPWFPVSYSPDYWDELISVTPTDSTWNRHFELLEGICYTQTISDSTQEIIRDLGVGIPIPEGGLERELKKENIKIFPNPTRGISNVEIDYDFKGIQKVNGEVYNIHGKLVDYFTEDISQGNNVFEIDLSDEANGMYFIQFSVDGKPVFEKKIIKNKNVF